VNITDPIRNFAQTKPGAVAIVRTDGTLLTYRELDQTLDAIATRIGAAGLRPHDTVAVGIANPFRYLIFLLALARAGVTCAPVAMPVLRASLCVLEGIVAAPPGVKVVELQSLWHAATHAHAPPPPVASCQDGDVIVGFFPSSGTTGQPKHVGINNDLFCHRVSSRALALALPDNLRQICHIGIGTWYGISSSVGALWQGGMIVLSESPKQIVPLIEKHQVNHLIVAPITLQHAMADMAPGSGPLPSLAMIEVGGSDLPLSLYNRAAQQLCSNIHCAYGALETGRIASAPMHLLATLPGAVGYVNAGVDVTAVDPQGMPLPAGMEGTLRIRSANCASSYADDDTLTAAVFRDGWVYTHDVGTVGTDGMVTLRGRGSDVINKGGTKVSPQAIEAVVLAFPGVTEVAAFGAPDADGIMQIWTAIVLRDPIDRDRLRALCKTSLGYAAPIGFIELPALPRTESGKVRREELVKIASDAMRKPPGA